MSFPVPEPSVTYNGQQRTSAEVANEATAARREAQIRYALSQQPNAPQMITQASPLSEAELVRERNKHLQREGNSVTAFRHHLAAIASERESVQGRLFSLRSQADAALREGATARVRELRSKIEDGTILSDRLDLLEADARIGLGRAERVEAAELSSLAVRAQEAEQRLAAYFKKLATFDRHAEAVAEIVCDEAKAEADHRVLNEASRRLPGRELPPPFPRGKDGQALRSSVIIPGYVSPPVRMPTAADAYER